jgi:hypothetical protein
MNAIFCICVGIYCGRHIFYDVYDILIKNSALYSTQL